MHTEIIIKNTPSPCQVKLITSLNFDQQSFFRFVDLPSPGDPTSSVRSLDLEMIYFHRWDLNTLSFSRGFRALKRSERDFFILASIV